MTLVAAGVAAGCEAAPVVDKTTLWGRLAPGDRDEREAFEDRVRLGLFFAGCLKYLLPLLCTVRVTVGEAAWEPFYKTFDEFLSEGGSEPDVAWLESAPHAGPGAHVCVVLSGRERGCGRPDAGGGTGGLRLPASGRRAGSVRHDVGGCRPGACGKTKGWTWPRYSWRVCGGG